MRRHRLTGPRPTRIVPDPGVNGESEAEWNSSPAIGVLGEPRAARHRRRRLFDPVSGWFRRLERAVNQWLSARVYPHVPGITRVYETILERQLTVSEADVVMPGLPPGFDETRVLFVADVHCGPFLTPGAVGRTFRRLAKLEPDLVLLGGDLTTSSVAEFTDSAHVFRNLRAPLGVYAVFGNHDHYNPDPPRLRVEIESCGIPVLHNDHTILERRGSRLALAGIDDLNRGRPDLENALRDIPAGIVVILVSHNPDVFFDAADLGVGLVLAGHTHGGQIRVPWLPFKARMSRYHLDEGRYAAEGAELVVSRGIGAVGLPLRLNCPPEAILLRLRRS